MSVLPGTDAIAFTARLRCADGHRVAALLMTAVEQRSLRDLSRLAAQMPTVRCECGRPYTVTALHYRFDEPGLPDLIYTVATGLTHCDGRPVSGEQDLIAVIGRPFAPADVHRSRLGALRANDAYRISPGVVTLAAPAEADDTVSVTAERFLAAAELAVPLLRAELGPPEGIPGEPPPLPFALGWQRDTGAGAWLGPAADAIDAGSLLVQNVVRGDLISVALNAYEPHEPDRTDPPLRFEVRVEADHVDCVARLGELTASVDLEAAAELTITKALTVHEAAAFTYALTAAHLQAIRTALAAVTPGLLEHWELRHGPQLVRVERDRPRRPRAIDLDAIADQVGQHAQTITARVHERLRAVEADPDGVTPAASLPCGCPPAHGAVLRPLKLARREGLLHLPFSASSAVVAVLDCEHHTAFIPDDVGEHEPRIWAASRDGLRTQQFRFQALNVTGLDEAVHGVVVLGHNAATPAVDGPLARGLAHAAGLIAGAEPGEEIQYLCVTVDLAAIIAPGGDAELVRRELAAVARDGATDQHVRAPRLLDSDVTYAAHGDRYGTFALTPLHRHAIDRIFGAGGV